MTIHLRSGLLLRRLCFFKPNHRNCSKFCQIQTEFHPLETKWNSEILQNLQNSFMIIPDFINEEEEMSLLKEVEPHLKRLVYEKSHWDEAIILFRETERKHWNKFNSVIIERLRQKSFKPESKVLPYVHVLDLSEDGHIKPHIDSPRVSKICLKSTYVPAYLKVLIFYILFIFQFCGDTVAVLSLMANSILKLVHDQTKEYSVKYLIPRRSLYIMT